MQNENVFRRANERLRGDWDRIGIEPAHDALFLCECGDPECKEPIRMKLDAYEAARGDGDTYLLLPGHEDADIETVVDELSDGSGRFTVVRKRGA